MCGMDSLNSFGTDAFCIGGVVTASSKQTGQAAALLLKHWRSETMLDFLPDDLAPRTRADGYRIGAEIAAQSGDRVIGWKIAATSEAGQHHINVDGPIAGRILSRRLLPANGTVTLGKNQMRVAEGEFAFSFAKALPKRAEPYSTTEVMEAVAGLHLSIEVPDSRYSDFTKVGAPHLIADSACASWLMLGDAVDHAWRGIDLSAHRVTAMKNGKEVASGTGKAVLGDPRDALAWLVNEVANHCGGILAGDRVTTGTCITPVVIAPGDLVTVDYGVLGSMSVRFV